MKKLSLNRNKANVSPEAINDEQKAVLKAINRNVVTFITGMAGVGKTYLSARVGLHHLLRQKYDRLILARPAIESYENLGYLPGTADEKLSVYMIPLLDVIDEAIGSDNTGKLLRMGDIVTLPLAFHRGLTYKNSFVIIDEAQNTLPEQMRLVLTRIGENCKVVITGDINQSDINKKSGLSDAIERLKDIEDVAITHLTEESVARHPVVKAIDKAYSVDFD